MKGMELEFLAFLYLCGESDKEILLKIKKMTFAEFERLEYISEKIGFKKLNAFLWNHYSGLFDKNFQYLLDLIERTAADTAPYADLEYEWEKQEKWIQEFLNEIPDEAVRVWMEKRIGSGGEE